MMRYYCSLWDHNYAAKGLALYESLIRHSRSDFRLYVLPMSDIARDELASLRLPKLQIVKQSEFELVMVMQAAKANRTFVEYCWTCASNLTYYVLNWMEVPTVTYLDSDLYFFDDPERIFHEIGACSIGITPHRLIPEKQHLIVNGIFNVGWVTFRNDQVGRTCLDQWAADCRAWCFNRHENGKFADQKYLDAWPARHGDAVAILDQPWIAAAPWNIGTHAISQGPNIDGQRICFYHLHELQEREDGTYKLTDYHLRNEDVLYIYEPYLKALGRSKEMLSTVMQ